VSRSSRLKLSIASTAAVALASLPFGITPASAAKVSEGATSSIGVVETSSNAQQFNLKTQGASTDLVARRGERNDGGGRKFVVPAFLQQLLEFLREISNPKILPAVIYPVPPREP
jgi:hypothetical protein